MHANSMIKKNISKEMTLEDLIRMVAKGFENTATKQDVIRLESDIARLDKKINDVKYELKQEIVGLECC